jgi:hypothetical protein
MVMYLLEKDLNNVLVTFLKRLQKLKQEAAENETGMAEKSRLGEIERKIAILSKTTTTTYRSSS